MTTQNNWNTLTDEVVYENSWIKVHHRDVINPAGKPGIYGLVSFQNKAVCIIPLDEENNIYLVGQFRYTIDEYSWEIPEGGGPLDEDPLIAAKRELKEETGLVAEKWSQIGRIHTSNSATDEEGFLYIAEILSQDAPETEDTEEIEVRKIPLAEAVNMVMRSEITDALSVAGIMMAARLKGI